MRRATFVLALLLSPIVLRAQQRPASPPAAAKNPVTDAFRGFSYYGSWLVTAFDSIPADRYAYKPTPVQQSVGYVAQHLEDANYQLCERFSGLRHERTAKDSLPDTVKAAWPRDTLVRRLRASLQFCGAAMARVDDANIGDTYAVGPAGSGRTTTRARDVMLFITDLADHYSQVAGYMRLMGLVPPSALPRPSR